MPDIYTPPEFVPRRRRRWPWVVGILGAIMLMCVLGSVLVAQTGTSTGNVPSTDLLGSAPKITMTQCKVDQFGLVKVNYTLVSTAKTTETFMPTFRITDADDAQIGTASGIEAEVRPGSTVHGEAMGTISGTVPRDITCSLVTD